MGGKEGVRSQVQGGNLVGGRGLGMRKVFWSEQGGFCLLGVDQKTVTGSCQGTVERE